MQALMSLPQHSDGRSQTSLADHWEPSSIYYSPAFAATDDSVDTSRDDSRGDQRSIQTKWTISMSTLDDQMNHGCC